MAKSTHLGRASQALWHLSRPIAKLCGNLFWRQYGNVQSPLGCAHGGLVAIRSSPSRTFQTFLIWLGRCLYESSTSPPPQRGGEGGGGEGEGSSGEGEGSGGEGDGGGGGGDGGDGGDGGGGMGGGKHVSDSRAYQSQILWYPHSSSPTWAPKR